MKRKMHDLALAGKWGRLGKSGFSSAEAPNALRVKNPSLSSKAVKAIPAKPAPICHKNSRREPMQSLSVGIDHLVQIEQQEAKRLQGAVYFLVPSLSQCYRIWLNFHLPF